MNAFALPEGRRGRLLALGFLAIAASLLWLVAVGPLVELHASRAERLAMREALVARFAAAGTAGASDPVLVEGETDAMAAARLQDIVRTRAEALGLDIARVETLSPEAAGETVKVGLRIDLECTYDDLVRLLADLRSAPATLAVEALSLEAGEDGLVRGVISIRAYRALGGGGAS